MLRLGATASRFETTWVRIVALIYTGGTVAQILRLIVRFGWQDIPFFPDWILATAGPIGVAGMVVHANRIAYRGLWERLTHWVIVAHLAISVLLHIWILIVRSHAVLSVFGYSYSYFAVVYFAFFAWRSWTLRFQQAQESPEGDGSRGRTFA